MPEKDKKKIESTDIWLKWQKSHDYMQKKGLISKTNKFWKFYLGDQWTGLKKGNEDLPTMNMIKPIVKYKVSTISQNAMIANYSDASANEGAVHQGIYKEFNRRFSQSWEKAKMTDVCWRNNKAAAVQGDSYVYFGTRDTNDQPQIIQNTAIFFGDENTENLQDQPYIIIRERLDRKTVVEEARENGIPEEEIQMIATDDNTEDEVFNRDEVKDKVTSLLYFTKIDGIVNFAKATKTCIYKPLEALTVNRGGRAIGGLTTYPIVPYIWEVQPNSARGLGEVEMLIPNQLELNKTLARRAIAVKLAAFPRIAYDATSIENPEDLDKVGKAIGVTTGNAQSISQAVSYLNPAHISGDAQQLFSDLLDQTKDLVGAGDNALGNIDPERASGQAIMAVRDQTQVPLNEQINTYQRFVEDVAMLWFDLWSTYDPDGFYEDVTDPTTGETRREKIPYEEIINLRPTVRIDVSQDNRWTKLAEQQAADQLLNNQQIGFSEWVELCAENGPIPKSKLLKIVRDRDQRQKEMQQQQAQQPPVDQNGNPVLPGEEPQMPPVQEGPSAEQVQEGAGNPTDNMEGAPVR